MVSRTSATACWPLVTSSRLVLATIETSSVRVRNAVRCSLKMPSQGLGAASASSRRLQPGASPSVSARSEEHTSELQSLMRISYAVFFLKKKILYYLFFFFFFLH